MRIMPPSVFSSAARLAFMVGHPVAHTALPARVNARAAEVRLDLMLAPIDVTPSGLSSFVAFLKHTENVDGAVVTAPHKAALAGLLDHASARVQRSGQANIIWVEDGRVHGDNTDGQGFVAALKANGFQPKNARCLIFGAGGAGAAIAVELCLSEAASIDLVDPDIEKSEAIALRLDGPVQSVTPPGEVSGFDLIVNATAVGLDGVSRVHDLRGVRTNAMVADVLATRSPTPLLKIAAQQGAATQTGQDLAYAQIPILANRFGWPSSIA